MIRHYSILLLMAVVMLFAGQADAVYDIYWTGAGGDLLWNNANNWWVPSIGEPDVPWPTDDTRIERVHFVDPNQTSCITINADMGLVKCGQLVMGWEQGAMVCATVDGGQFNPVYIRVSGGAGAATFNVTNNATVNAVGPDGINGMIFIGDSEGVDQGFGIMNVYSGNVFVAWALRVGSSAHYVEFDFEDPDAPLNGTKGELNLYGGEMVCNGPVMIFPASETTYKPLPLPYAPGGSGRINIEQGVLKFAGFDPVGMEEVMQQYISDGRITAYDGHPRARVHYAFDDILYKIVVWASIDANFFTAYNPSPENESTEQYCYSNLTWNAGDEAVQHDVYFGTVLDDVNNATNALPVGGIYKGRQTGLEYNPGILELGMTYYWRIDEVKATQEITKGDVWSFTVTSQYVLEHFDTYFNEAELSGRWTVGGNTELLLEKTPQKVRSGTRSMILNYDNMTAPYYSQASLEFHKPIDLTLDARQFLSMFFHGVQTNTADVFYIRLEDSFGQLSPKVFYSGNAANLTVQSWKPWQDWSDAFNVPFSSVTGVNLTAIKKVHVGLGNGVSVGGSGTLLIDDIAVFPSSCVIPQDGDFNGDCTVDLADVAVLSGDFLESGYTVTPSALPAARVWYKFDEGPFGLSAADSSGNGFNGTLNGPANVWNTTGGKVNGCINMNLTGANPWGVQMPKNAWSTITNQMSITVWVKGDIASQPPQVDNDQYLFHFGYGTTTVRAACPIYNGDVEFFSGQTTTGTTVTWRPESSSAWAGQWNHYAFTKNATTGVQRMYRNGVLLAENIDSTDSLSGVFSTGTQFWVGSANGTSWGGYKGSLDDFRLYAVELTQAQIASLITATGGSVYQPAPATDLSGNAAVDIADLAMMLQSWLMTELYPN